MSPLELINVANVLGNRANERWGYGHGCRTYEDSIEPGGLKRYRWTTRLPDIVQRITHFTSGDERRFYMICITEAGRFAARCESEPDAGFSGHRWVVPPTPEQEVHLHLLFGDVLSDLNDR